MPGSAITRSKSLRNVRKTEANHSDANRLRVLQEFMAIAREIATTETFVDTARNAAENASASVLKKTIARWKKTRLAFVAPCPPAKQQLVDALTQGYVYSAEEDLISELETQQQAFLHSRELLHGAWSEAEVARQLGISPQAVESRLQNQILLAVKEQGAWKFPFWQFDADSVDGVLAGLPDVLRALDVSDMSKISWLTLPNRYLEGRTPLQAMQEGEVKRVVDQAWAVGCR